MPSIRNLTTQWLNSFGTLETKQWGTAVISFLLLFKCFTHLLLFLPL